MTHVITNHFSARVAEGPVHTGEVMRCIELDFTDGETYDSVAINVTAQQAGELAGRLIQLITQTPDFMKEGIPAV